MRFTPIEDFFSEPFDSHYVAGLHYTVRPGNDRLMQAVAQWVCDGKVLLVPQMPGVQPAQLGGAGVVTGSRMTPPNKEGI